jgi:steroid delta-isomerase-like uncharacterized protein
MGTPASSPRIVLRRLFDQVWNGGDMDVADSIFGDAAQAKAFITGFRACFPDIVHTVEETVTEGDRVVIRWRAQGTHQKAWSGFAATHRVVAFTGITVAVIHDGKIQRHKTEWDKASLLEQLR